MILALELHFVVFWSLVGEERFLFRQTINDDCDGEMTIR